MYLIYTDEAGNTGTKKDADQPIHMIGALLVEDSKVEKLADDFRTIVAARFPDIFWQNGFEVHGSAVFGGDGLFKTVKPAERLGMCNDIFDMLVTSQTAVMWTAIDKMTCFASDHPHTLAFRFLAERLEDYLIGKDSLGLIIADENKEMEQKVIDDLVRYKQSNTGWGYRPTQITRIIDSVHFVQSKNNVGVQIVDLVTYFINKGLRLRDQMQAAYQVNSGGLTFSDYKAANPLKPALQAVLDLQTKITPCVVATKRF